MADLFNIYCDESGHLEHDHLPVMVLGAVWCPQSVTREVAERIREIKTRHGLDRRFEVKWTKVSPAKAQLYLDLVGPTGARRREVRRGLPASHHQG